MLLEEYFELLDNAKVNLYNSKTAYGKRLARQTLETIEKLGVEKVKQFVRAGKLDGEQTDDGYWKIKVYNDDCVSKEVYDKEVERRIKAETTLETLKKIIGGQTYEK